MRKTSLLILLLLTILSLVGCSGENGPSDKVAKEIIYGLYLADIDIVKKDSCAFTTGMENQGHTNVWFIQYRFEKSGKFGGVLITEVDGEWQPYRMVVDGCPE